MPEGEATQPQEQPRYRLMWHLTVNDMHPVSVSVRVLHPVLSRVEAEPEKKPVIKSGKVEVRLQAAGDAPIMKQKNYKVPYCP